MDTIWTAIRMMSPGCYMASIDLKDAYYSVPIHKDDQKYLKFYWRGTLYQYTCFPNGLAICPRKFTKLLKPVFSNLRSLGHLSVIFIDDSYLQGADFSLCVKNVQDTVALLDRLGLIIHPEKSVLNPTQKLVFLGFVLDSIKMVISLTNEKACKIKEACQKLLQSHKTTIREVARVLGMLTASFPGVMFGPLHYRNLDMDKTAALKFSKGNYNKTMTISDEAKHDLRWWVSSVETTYNVVSHGQVDITMTTDASKTGWGCSLGGIPTGGSWEPGESEKHINWLKVKAILLSLKSFVDHISKKHVKILSDNTTAVCCINHMGTSHSQEINFLVTEIWELCIKHNVWITVAHIPGKQNVIADFESRRGGNNTEWALDQTVYDQATQLLEVTPCIDLFASRLNYKCKPYVAFRRDPEAQAINAFCISWANLCFYAFPPFCIINRVLQKISEEKATGIIVIPHWPTQSWWPCLTNMLINCPLMLPSTRTTLTLPWDPQKIHPLQKTLRLLMCHLSGDCLKVKEFQQKLRQSLCKHGGLELKNSTDTTCKSGNNTVVNEVSIPFLQM